MIYYDKGFYNKSELDHTKTFCTVERKERNKGAGDWNITFELYNINDNKIYMIDNISIPEPKNVLTEFIDDIEYFLPLIKIDMGFLDSEIQAIRTAAYSHAYQVIGM